jgi:hypothetical protein
MQTHLALIPKGRIHSFKSVILQRETTWWWKGVWKLNCPPKSKLFMWCLLVKRVPTWDFLAEKKLKALVDALFVSA